MLLDENQLPAAEIKRICAEAGHGVVPNSFGTVVKQDWVKFDFVKRRTAQQEYNVEQVIQRVRAKNEIVFGTLCNYVQYFAELGGFDTMLNLICMGTSQEEQEGGPAIKLPFSVISQLSGSFTHLGQVFVEEFGLKLTNVIKQQITQRLQSISEAELKNVQKDEVTYMLHNMRSFLEIGGETRDDIYYFIEHTQLAVALRFLKSENLEKRLKGLNDIRYMIERATERYRYERWR